MTNHIEQGLKEFWEDMRDIAFEEFQKTDTYRYCERKRERLFKECISMASDKICMENSLDELIGLGSMQGDYLYERGVSDGMKILLSLLD